MEFSIGLPPFLSVKFTDEELAKFWKGAGEKVRPLSKVKDFENLFGRYSQAQAESILKILYREYFERELDDVGRSVWTPYIQEFGFSGIMRVTYHLLQSDEMNQKVTRDLTTLYQKHLHRDPDPVGMVAHDKWIRFFGKAGRQHVENEILHSGEYRGEYREKH